MQVALNYILNNYLRSKEEKFKNHPLANFVRKNVKEVIQNETSIDVLKYKVEGSPGKGNWADIPWIAIFDNEITNTATKGYYIVYLFCSDMSGFYISLNQGWTYFKDKYGVKKGREKIRLVSDSWKAILSSTLKNFSYEPIQLKGVSKNSDLAEGYELGHICGNFYEVGKIPKDDELIKDLRNLMGVYRELKGKLKENSVEKTNNYLIVNNNLGLLYDIKEDDGINNIEDTIEGIEKHSLLVKEEPPRNMMSKEDDSVTFKPKKTNFLRKAKNQKKLGFAGELMVLKYEREKLISNGKKFLADQVKHISKDEGDGAGYDILSFKNNGDKKYIEVKTTIGSKTTPFMITSNELKFAELNSENYYLYRIFDFNKEINKGKFYILDGDINKKLHLKPKQYFASRVKTSYTDEVE